MDLHGQIMNIPFAMPDDVTWTHGDIQAAKIGHRDARHAAAELALKADACVQALRDILAIADRGQAAVNTFLLIDAREALAKFDGA